MQLCATIITVKQNFVAIACWFDNIFSLPFLWLIIVPMDVPMFKYLGGLLMSDLGQSRCDFRSLHTYVIKYLLTWKIFITMVIDK